MLVSNRHGYPLELGTANHFLHVELALPDGLTMRLNLQVLKDDYILKLQYQQALTLLAGCRIPADPPC